MAILAAAGAPVSGQPTRCAPVLLEQVEIVRICWSTGAVRTDARAAAMSERLLDIASDPGAPPVQVRSIEGLVVLMSGQDVVGGVFDGDAHSARVSKEQLAAQWAAACNTAIELYRAAHSTRRLIIRGALAVFVLGAGLVLLILIRRRTRMVEDAVWSRLRRRMQSADARVIELLPNEITHNLVIRAVRLLRLALSILVIYGVAQVMLGLFPATRHVAGQMLKAVLGPVQAFAAATWRAGPSLAFVALVGLATWYLMRFIRYSFRKIGDGAISIQGFRPAWAGTTQKLVSFCIAILAVLISYPYIPGSQSNAFKGGLLSQKCNYASTGSGSRAQQ
jgi:hypothetical protein